MRRFDLVARTAAVVAEQAAGRLEIAVPDSRAVLFHFKKVEPAKAAGPGGVTGGQ